MTIGFKDRFKIVMKSLEYVGKLLSTAIIVILLIIGAFLVYYVVSAKILSTQEGGVPKISLYTIVSGSMEPAIKVYDVIFDVRVDDPSTVKIGDVITFKSTSTISADKIVTHRVLDIRNIDGKYEFVTKGDNNPTADSDTAKAANLIGKTVLKIPQLGRIQVFIASKMGWLIVVLIPALSVIIYDILKLFKVIKAKGTTDHIEATPFEDIVRGEEDKKIEETLEKIQKSQDLYNLQGNTENTEDSLSNTIEFSFIPVDNQNDSLNEE